MPTPPAEIGLFGLAVMGQNLALNIARHGFAIAVHNRTPAVVDRFLAESVRDGDPVVGARTPGELVAALARPRRIVLMVKAGDPVDATIDTLRPLLEPGDMIIDAGNSHPHDTERRSKMLEGQGLRFVGMGVSGGEEGALHGPSLMPGGPREAYDELEPILTAIAAKSDDGPCVTYLGSGAAGHFVKMVHNGIEYGDMQLIAEAYDLLHGVLGLEPEELAATFAEWNRGLLESFLIEITADILAKRDPRSGGPMVDAILDVAAQKGTGRWTAEYALELGVPAPTIHAAVDARSLSSAKDLRVRLAEHLPGPAADPPQDRGRASAQIGDALYASKICSYAQGMALLRAADAEYGWGLELAEVARIWKAGCIIRARLLDDIAQAWRRDRDLASLLLDAPLGGWLAEHQTGWRSAIALAAESGVPVLAMAASLSYFDSLRRARLPQSLTQAQRDYFGAHTLRRADDPAGQPVHIDWQGL